MLASSFCICSVSVMELLVLLSSSSQCTSRLYMSVQSLYVRLSIICMAMLPKFC